MTPRQQLEQLVELFAPDIRSAFLAAIQDVVDNAIVADVIKAIELGDPEAAFRALGFSDAAMRPLTAAIERAFEQGGVMTGKTFPKYLNTPSGRAVFRFDVRNSRAEAWLRDKSSSLIVQIGEDTRINVKNVLQRGMTDGRNPRNVALDIVGRIDPVTKKRVGGIVGLTQQQEYWVANTRRDLYELNEIAHSVKQGGLTAAQAREKLDGHSYFNRALRRKGSDRVIIDAISSGKELDGATVEKLVTAYKNNALKYRGDSIARTEAIHALNQSEYEAHKQAVDLGAARAEDVTRIWDSAGDTRVRWSHRALDGQKRGLDEPFTSPSGAQMMFPGDTSLGAPGNEVIMCRCRVRLKVDWLADLDQDGINP